MCCFFAEVKAGPGSGPAKSPLVGAGAGSKGRIGEVPMGLFIPIKAHTAINNVSTCVCIESLNTWLAFVNASRDSSVVFNSSENPFYNTLRLCLYLDVNLDPLAILLVHHHCPLYDWML